MAGEGNEARVGSFNEFPFKVGSLLRRKAPQIPELQDYVRKAPCSEQHRTL